MEKLKINIYANSLKINNFDLNGSLYYEDETKLIRKNITQIEIICDDCKSKIVWKTIPAKQ